MINKYTIEDFSLLTEEICELNEQMQILKEKEDCAISKIKKMFPKYFWTCEIERYWHKPLRYKINSVECFSNKLYIKTKDVRKKKPFNGWNPENIFSLEEFLNIALYDSYDAALDGYRHRICNHCGGYIGDSDRVWCNKCIDEYGKYLEDNARKYYDADKGHTYEVKPDIDPVLRRYFWRGYDGHYFKLRRLDTGEIIETHNLWSLRDEENVNNYPLIEFLND